MRTAAGSGTETRQGCDMGLLKKIAHKVEVALGTDEDTPADASEPTRKTDDRKGADDKDGEK